MKVALIGTAHPHVRDHLEVALSGDRWQLGPIWESNVVSTVPIPSEHVVPTIGDAIADADVLVVDTETDFHVTLLPQLATSGKPLFIEKPLGISAVETRTIAERIRLTGNPFSTGLMLRQLVTTNAARSAIAAGAIGEVLSVDLRFGHPGYSTGWFMRECAWMLDPFQAGLHGFGDIGLHLLDFLAWLRPLRTIDVTAAWLASGAVRSHGAGLLDWGGVPVTIAAGWIANPGGLFIRIEGRDGTIRIDRGEYRLERPGAEPEMVHGEPPRSTIALEAFLRHLQGDEVAIPTIDDAERASVLAYTLESAALTR